jgi:hypothetical protein
MPIPGRYCATGVILGSCLCVRWFSGGAYQAECATATYNTSRCIFRAIEGAFSQNWPPSLFASVFITVYRGGFFVRYHHPFSQKHKNMPETQKETEAQIECQEAWVFFIPRSINRVSLSAPLGYMLRRKVHLSLGKRLRPCRTGLVALRNTQNSETQFPFTPLFHHAANPTNRHSTVWA